MYTERRVYNMFCLNLKPIVYSCVKGFTVLHCKMYEYKESRSTCVAARDAPVLISSSPFQTRDELLLEKCHFRKRKPFTDHMRRGVELEPVALQQFCKEMKIDISEVQKPGFTRHPQFDYIGGVPDGIWNKTLIEIKCPSRFTQGDTPPQFYEDQMQVYMQIFDLKQGMYVEYIEGEKLNILTVERKDVWWQWITPIIKCFWEEVQFWRQDVDSLIKQFEIKVSCA